MVEEGEVLGKCLAFEAKNLELARQQDEAPVTGGAKPAGDDRHLVFRDEADQAFTSCQAPGCLDSRSRDVVLGNQFLYSVSKAD
jgi:hypothetical protein